MRGLSATVETRLQGATAEQVLAYAVEHYHPRLTLACSFQKEESVLFHMLSEIEPSARAFTIDTGVLFPETLATWKQFEDRFPLRIDVIDAHSPGRAVDARELLLGGQGRGARDRAVRRRRVDHRDPPRAGDHARQTATKFEHDERRGIVKFNPLADWTEKDVWTYIFKHDLPYNPLHDQGYDSIGCAPCTLPGNGRDGRWAGLDKTECGIHVA